MKEQIKATKTLKKLARICTKRETHTNSSRDVPGNRKKIEQTQYFDVARKSRSKIRLKSSRFWPRTLLAFLIPLLFFQVCVFFLFLFFFHDHTTPSPFINHLPPLFLFTLIFTLPANLEVLPLIRKEWREESVNKTPIPRAIMLTSKFRYRLKMILSPSNIKNIEFGNCSFFIQEKKADTKKNPQKNSYQLLFPVGRIESTLYEFMQSVKNRFELFNLRATKINFNFLYIVWRVY